MAVEFTAYEASDGATIVRSTHATVLKRFYGRVVAVFTVLPDPVAVTV